MAATLPFTIDDHDVTSALAAVGPVGSSDAPVYRYDGPLGPVHVACSERPSITRLWGDDVPIATFDVGMPALEDRRLLRRGPEPIASGAIGFQPVTVRQSAEARRGVGALTVALGTARYELSSSGILPRVVLYRDDLREVATYTVLGRRPHRIAEDATPEEVVLVVFLVRFAHRLAYRR
jgi:hypothetical protein